MCFASVSLIYAQKNEVSYSKVNNVFRLKVKNSSEKMSLSIKGDVKLGNDDKRIDAISPNGYVEFESKKQSLAVNSGSNGNLSYKINGVKKTSPGAEEMALLEECVKTMISYGIDGNNRAKRIFASGGSSAVLNEVSRFKSDYVKEMYLSSLLKNQQLSKDEMIALLKKTDQYLSSDYYKSELLNGVMHSFLNDEATFDAYLNTVMNFKSDYYQYTSVKNLLKSSLNEKQYEGVISIVARMKSDYYQSEVLKSLLKNNSISGDKFTGLMNITTKIKSDYYQSEIYKEVLNHNVKEESDWSKLIQSAGNISSDYYQSEVLLTIADKMPANESLTKQLREVAKKIKSDYYYGKVAKKIGE